MPESPGRTLVTSVLFLDIVRPTRFPGSLLNRIVLRLIRWSPFVQDAIRNQKAWEYRIGTGPDSPAD